MGWCWAMSVRRNAVVFTMLLLCVAGVFAITAYNWFTTETTVEHMKKQNEIEHQRIDAMYQSMRLGPRHTACDTVLILNDLRAIGLKLPRYPVEDRCQQ